MHHNTSPLPAVYFLWHKRHWYLQVPDGDDPGAILPDEDGVSPVADPALQHCVPAHRHPAASNINIFIYITKTFSSFIIRISLRDTRYIYIYIILFWNFECNLFWIFSPLPLPTHITSKMDVWMSGWWWINKTQHKFEERKGKLKHFPPPFLAPVVLWSCQDLWSRLQLCGRNQIVRRTWNIKIYWFY